MAREFPHVTASFINEIAEDGTKAEAVAYLQKQWNEACALRVLLKEAVAVLKREIEKIDEALNT